MLKNILLYSFLILTIESKSQIVYSESVFSEEKEFKFEGIDFSSKVTVIDSLSKIKVTLTNKKKKDSNVMFEFKFDDLILDRYLTIYNSLILLSDKNGAYYLDLITNKRINTDIGNKYNESMSVGLYNPVLKNGILKIYNYKLDLIESIILPNQIKNTIYHTLFFSDVMYGKISIIALVKYGRSNAENIYYMYQYNIKTKKSFIK